MYGQGCPGLAVGPEPSGGSIGEISLFLIPWSALIVTMAALLPSPSLAREVKVAGRTLMATRPVELMREFIHDCLYNPRTGYFQHHVNIVRTSPKINFCALRHAEEYYQHLHQMYESYGGHQKDPRPASLGHPRSMQPTQVTQQLWHTPSELFRPWYGEGIARYIVEAHHISREPLVIYEVGPGNGTLAGDILNYLARESPSLYKCTEYHLIEISGKLARSSLSLLAREHPRQVRLHRHSFLEHRQRDERPLHILFAEVFDNLPQDRIRFRPGTGDLEQAVVITNDKARWHDEQARYTEAYEPVSDALILDTVNAMEEAGHTWPSLRPSHWEWLYDLWPLTHFLFARPWASEFIPSVAYRCLCHVQALFPRHRLLLTDFHELPDRVPGHGAPVVQTRWGQETVACSSVLLERGLFDIFFPYDFQLLARLYQGITGRTAMVGSHADFCHQFMDVRMTRTRSGFNPLLEEFKNVSFLYSQDGK